MTTAALAAPPRQDSPAKQDTWSHVALLTPSAGYFAYFAIAASLVLPFEGFGIDLCGLHRLTALPCPGCGLTRAFVLFAQGDWALAAASNPFVLVLYPLFIAMAALVLLPAGMRAAAERWLAAHAQIVGRAYRVGLFAFLGFGGLRFAYFIFSGERFP